MNHFDAVCNLKLYFIYKQARSLGPFLEIIKDVIKNWSLDYKENNVDILNNTEYVNPDMKSFGNNFNRE